MERSTLFKGMLILLGVIVIVLAAFANFMGRFGKNQNTPISVSYSVTNLPDFIKKLDSLQAIHEKVLTSFEKQIVEDTSSNNREDYLIRVLYFKQTKEAYRIRFYFGHEIGVSSIAIPDSNTWYYKPLSDFSDQQKESISSKVEDSLKRIEEVK